MTPLVFKITRLQDRYGNLKEPFTVTTGVRQICILSPLLFLMVINWVSKTAYKEPKGIQWTLQTRLEDLDFADDICMLSHHSYQDMQHQATCLEEKAKQTGLLINPQKTKTMRINTTQTDKLIRDTEVENVEQFMYLGSSISTTGEPTKTSKLGQEKLNKPLPCLSKFGEVPP